MGQKLLPYFFRQAFTLFFYYFRQKIVHHELLAESADCNVTASNCGMILCKIRASAAFTAQPGARSQLLTGEVTAPHSLSQAASVLPNCPNGLIYRQN
jgi:hypothetical protein